MDLPWSGMSAARAIYSFKLHCVWIHPDCKASLSLLSHRYVLLLGALLMPTRIKPACFSQYVWEFPHGWLQSCRLTHQWQQPLIRGAWRLPWHRESQAFLFGRSTSKTRADRGADNALAKGRSRELHWIMLLFPAWCCLWGAARCPKAGRAGGKHPWPLQQVYCSGDTKSHLSRRPCFLRLLWSHGKKFL